MNELALFTGIGGGLLGSRLLGWKCICAVEIDEYCREVLLQRQRDGMLDLFPIWDDAKTFDGTRWHGLGDVITAGFPCQPFSVAGKRKGMDDDRNLWPDTIRIIREVRPQYAFLENVPGLLSSEYFGTILKDLAESGFDTKWRVLSAAEVGAPHKRDRLWILAHPHGKRLPKLQIPGLLCETRAKIHATEPLLLPTWKNRPRSLGDFPRMDAGIPHRVDRLKSLGNAQVPLMAATAWELLTKP